MAAIVETHSTIHYGARKPAPLVIAPAMSVVKQKQQWAG
jgi:hypothetical protein